MKCLITAFFIFFFCGYQAIAQSDVLLINLKNGQTDSISISQIQKIQFENISGVSETDTAAKNLDVKGNNPNPFTEQTNVEFEIVNPGNVEILIYDNTGNQIQKLECKNCQSGKNSLQWNCLDKNNNRVLSGIYFYEVRFNNEIKSKKMILVK